MEGDRADGARRKVNRAANKAAKASAEKEKVTAEPTNGDAASGPLLEAVAVAQAKPM